MFLKLKKVLIISYYFPPYRGVGARRIGYVADMLKKNGIKPIVLRAADINYEGEIDKSTKVINVENIQVFGKNSFLLNVLFNSRKYKNAAIEIVKKHKISMVYISGGPFFYFPLGKSLYKKFGVPYILDYRDNYFLPPKNLPETLHKFVFKYLWDKPALKNASYIINVTETLTKLHRQENSRLEGSKFITVFNGYDERVSISRAKTYDFDKADLYLGIFGKFSYYNMKDVKSLVKAAKLVNFKILFVHVGEVEKEFVDCVQGLSAEKYFKFLGYRPYETGLGIMNSMDALVLNNREPYALGTKIFDYVYLNKPIIAFTTRGSEIENFLSNFINGYTVFDNNVEQLQLFIKKIKSLKKKELGVVSQIGSYSRKSQFNIVLDNIKKLLNVDKK